MSPELPSAVTGGPVDSEAASRRFVYRAWAASARRLGLAARLARLIGVVGLASALSATLFVAAANADALTDRRDQVKRELTQARAQVADSYEDLSAANAAVQRTSAELDTARAALARTRTELDAAEVRDRQMAVELDQARAALARAKAAVAAAQRALDAELEMAGNVVRDQYQQQTNLLPIALLVEPSTADLATRLQWSTTMFDTTQAQIDRLTTLRRQLRIKQDRQAELERQVATERQRAADNLKLKQSLKRRAAAQEAAVSGLLARQRTERQVAASELAQDQARYAELNRERATVERRIAIRIAQAKAAAARKAAAAAARKAAAAARAAEKAHRQQRRSASRVSPPAMSSGNQRGSAGSSSSGGSVGGSTPGSFSYPISAAITSAYGMRLHPILKYWKLHDGTDFGAGCGTAIRAPYAGRVAERYFNSAYGNRLMIDHGLVGGRYVTTGYNHAARYVVRVGERVRKGQVIGYVGTTGLSTGCHLHLMVWRNGRLVNPMSLY